MQTVNISENLIILGFGGHARSVADVALSLGVKQLKFVDVNAKDGENFLGFPVLRSCEGVLPNNWQCFPAAGDNKKRQEQLESAKMKNWSIATIIAPTATVGVGSVILEGSFVAQHAHIGPLAEIGVGSLINTGAIVEHECKIGNYVHVSINTAVAGRSKIGDLCFIGTGASIINGINICKKVIIGAGAVVINDIMAEGVYVGVPCQYCKSV